MHRSRIACACRVGIAALLACAPAALRAQGLTRVSREDAVAAALQRGARMGVARADTTLARAGVLGARQYENPALGLSYSKSVPQEHYSLDIPIDFPWLRGARIGSAEAARASAQHRFRFERRAVEYDVDTLYTRVIASAARARLSSRTARDADSLLTLAKVRRDAGDGSELDVQLAQVSAGQMANAAASDSLDAVGAVLGLQVAMGLSSERVTVEPADTLALPTVSVSAVRSAVDASAAAPSSDATAGGGAPMPLLVAAAQSDVLAADQALTQERRRTFPGASLSVGWEAKDPTGSEPGTLPTIGIAFPFPLFNRNDAAVLAAQAQADRARAQLALARVESSAAIALAARAMQSAMARAERSGRLVSSADRVAALSLTAFREGASALPNVLEAQRTAREALSQYITDVAAARNAAGLYQLLTLTANGINP